MGTALGNVTAIKAWVVATFSGETNIQVYLGVDADNPPAATQAPAVFIWEMSRSITPESRGDYRHYSRRFAIVAWVSQDSFTSSGTGSNIHKYHGLVDVDRLLELAWKEVHDSTVWPIFTGAAATDKRVNFSDMVIDRTEIAFPDFTKYGVFEIEYTDSS